eukprot:s7440_g2.t1
MRQSEHAKATSLHELGPRVRADAVMCVVPCESFSRADMRSSLPKILKGSAARLPQLLSDGAQGRVCSTQPSGVPAATLATALVLARLAPASASQVDAFAGDIWAWEFLLDVAGPSPGLRWYLQASLAFLSWASPPRTLACAGLSVALPRAGRATRGL